jgi:hypothetical protein
MIPNLWPFGLEGKKKPNLFGERTSTRLGVSPKTISKLLGTPFGFFLGFIDVDNLLEKMQHKLRYWSTTKLSLVGRKVIVNNILLSSLWYFVNVWGGTRKGVQKVNHLLKNYLWFGFAHKCQCCEKKERGLSLVDPIEPMEVMLSKWVIHALESQGTPIYKSSIDTVKKNY